MSTCTKKVSRRGFLRQAAACAAGLASAPLLGGCARGQPAAAQTVAAISPTGTNQPTMPAPTASPTPLPTAAAQPVTATASVVEAAAAAAALTPGRSRLVQAVYPGVWQGENLSAEGLGQMLDRSITAFTGVEDAQKAWARIFRSGERVAIKVNAIISGSSHVPLVMAVTERLQNAGIAAEDIVIYDRSDDELKNAGFAFNRGGKGIRCQGNNGLFGSRPWKVLDSDVHLSRMLEDCDALINIPVLKGLTIGGISFALKNHYGSIDNPSRFHDSRFSGGVTGLNALDPLRRKTRLIIGDVLAQETHADWTSYAVIGGASAILMGADPVSVDLLGLQMCLEALGQKGINTAAVKAQSEGWLKAGAALGLGSDDLNQVDIQKIQL